jgi:hypothetical protein
MAIQIAEVELGGAELLPAGINILSGRSSAATPKRRASIVACGGLPFDATLPHP